MAVEQKGVELPSAVSLPSMVGGFICAREGNRFGGVQAGNRCYCSGIFEVEYPLVIALGYLKLNRERKSTLCSHFVCKTEQG